MTYILFIRGYGRREPELIRKLVEATGMSPADARLCLASQFPRNISAHPDADKATEALEKLIGCGLEGFVASEEEIDHPPTIVVAGKATIEGDSVSWWHVERQGPAPPELGNVQDRFILQTREHVQAILRASVRWLAKTELQVTKTSTFQGLKVPESRSKGTTTEGDREQILLVQGSSHDSFILVSERKFDFSNLWSERFYGPGVNIGRLAGKLRTLFPDARYDESLVQFTGEMGFVYQSAKSARTGPGKAETRKTDHNSNYDSVIHMARLLAMQ